MEELDQECEGFHLALEKSISSREEVVGEMNRMQAQCSDLQATLEDQQVCVCVCVCACARVCVPILVCTGKPGNEVIIA